MCAVTAGMCIHVQSELNDWMDLCVIPENEHQFFEVKRIVEVAFDSYWEDDKAQFETLGDWIHYALADADVKAKIYFGEDWEDDVA